MRVRLGGRLAWIMAVTAVAIMIPGISLSLIYVLRTGDGDPLLSHQGVLHISTPLFAFIGALIASRQPRNAIGWLFLTAGLCTGLGAISTGYQMFQPLYPSIRLPLAEFVSWLNRWVFLLASTLAGPFMFLLFPDGHLPSRKWAPVAWGAALGLAGEVLINALHPDALGYIGGVSPYRLSGIGPVLEKTLIGFILLSSASALGSILALVHRFYRSSGTEREQMKWLVFALGITILGVLLIVFGAVEVGFLITSIGILGVPVAVGIAVLRYKLYDINMVINRTLVYGALTIIVVVIYLLFVVGLGLLFEAQGSLLLSLLGVGMVATIVQPVRDRLQRAVNRLMYGERDNPYAALSRLGQRLESTIAPEAVLPIIVEIVAQSLKLPYAAMSLAISSAMPSDASASDGNFPIVAAYGSPTGDLLHLPLVYQGETIGALIVGPRSGESFSSADRHLLDDLARQAGVAVHAVRLTRDLQRSRQRLVTTREEERRRLRRDLHDGLGSQLAALHLQADTLRTLIPDQATAARGLASEIRDEIHDAIADIRRLVYELRPPALDEIGLAGAIRALASQSTAHDGLQVAIDTNEPLPPLPAAVEVAAYRISQEALANVVHHSHARNCVIQLKFAEELSMEISDNGVGLPAGSRAGVGLRSMRERAAELGGTCIVENALNSGARVVVRLPLNLEKE